MTGCHWLNSVVQQIILKEDQKIVTYIFVELKGVLQFVKVLK